ncbi:hypothetical protein J2Y45_003758 [Dyadobacter sp. BE34]|uniref:Uncharacterized protein n=1 Tax=Dyadobacter fermentans TaxID=94254 RepID=A0ABU1QZL4_9BACT|nr:MULTISPECIES: hypothetical protein [Dyadobacter]MDR6806566.1 hypothetical protein [Dyadobacter fermentans]MDR7044307.1 hypothetical protein [Dyadobacter sp. BE242]MDR7198618.1 hypothetical protein [Dyadobacter sp. BE34]MDR7216580.1 hypothetical protein [Dyadobacter sp. BE31]MDR7263894.1 hypothetical protein [Dyadobacter sp. BE32]
MGFGFNLLVVFVFLPLTVVCLIIWLSTNKKPFIKSVAIAWAGLLGLVLLSTLARALTSKVILTKDDYYGNYVIKRDYFPGKQTDWQYNSFRFELKSNDSIYFHITDGAKITKTYRGVVEMPSTYRSKRLNITMQMPTHHIVMENPTTYRGIWSFYLVFHSSEFGNVFFEKGDWEPIP